MMYWSEMVRLFERDFIADGWKVHPCSKKGFGAGLIENKVDKVFYVITGSDSESRPLSLKRIERVRDSFSAYKGKKINMVVFIGRFFSEGARKAVEDGVVRNTALLELGLLRKRPSPRLGVKVFAPEALKNDFLILKLKGFLGRLPSKLRIGRRPLRGVARGERGREFRMWQGRRTTLTGIPLISRVRCQVLRGLGIRTPSDILSTDPSKLSSNERIRKCDGAFPSQIPLIANYARSMMENEVIVSGVDEAFVSLADSELYFLDLEYCPETPIFLYGLMDSEGNVTQIFVDNHTEERKALEEFLSLIGEKKPVFVTYASKGADEPVLRKSIEKFHLSPDPLERAQFYDLYHNLIFTRSASKQRIFLPIKPITEKSVSDYLGYREPRGLRIHDGLQALQAYTDYLRGRDEKIKDQLILYNRSDLERIKLIYEKLRDLFARAFETFPPFQKMESIRQEILSGKVPKLRNDISLVCVSDISGQYYCEMKVELRNRLGERPSELMEVGVEAHTDLLKEAEKAQHREVWGAIASGESLFVSTLILAEYDGIPIPGRPDWIYFRDRRPILVFEYKFRAGRIRPYSHDHVQAGVYSWILKELGFDITGLKYALVIAPGLCKGCEKMRRIHKLIVRMDGMGVSRTQICECTKVQGREPWVYICSPDYAKINEELGWALGYWRGERNPIPTSKRNKCKKCGYRNECSALKPEKDLDQWIF